MRARRTLHVSHLFWHLSWVSFACLLLFAASHDARAQGSVFRLQSARGQVLRQGRPVGRGTHVAAVGDRIKTGANSSVYIVTPGGQRIALGSNTEVILREPNQPRGWRVVVGRIWATLTGGKKLEIRAPGAVAAAEGTTFQLDVADDGTTVLTVVEGVVRFYNDLGSVQVVDRQQSTAKPGSAPTRPVVVDPTGLVAWEASLQTLIIEPEYPQVGTDPEMLEQELDRRSDAAQRAPQDAAAQAAVTEVLLDLGRTEEAREGLQSALEVAPDEASLRGLLGFALLQDGRPEEAGAEFAAASQAQPQDPRWQIGTALVALGQRDGEPAVALLQRVTEMAPDNPAGHAYLAAVHMRLGDLEAADQAASAAVRVGPDNHLANAYLAYVRLVQGDVDAAVAAGTKAVEVAPRSALAHESLGTAQFFAGNLKTARAELEQAAELNPMSASAQLTLAKLLAAEEDIVAAMDTAQVAVSLNPQSAPAHSTMGLLFMLNNDRHRAAREFKKALALDPGLAEARAGWGDLLVRRGRFKEALDEQKAAVELDTGSAAAANNLGAAYAAMGQMDEAIESLNRAIELQPGWGMPHANLALVHLEENRYREALDEGEEAVELGERSAFLHTVLARIYMRQGRTDRALAELRQAVSLDPDYPQAHYQLAQLYLEQDRARDAVREILASVTTDPSSMLETRKYARTEVTLSGGSYGTGHFDARHSDMPDAEGRFSYFASGMFEHSDGFRAANQDRTEKFGELIAGYQPQDTSHLVFYGTAYQRTAGLPGPVTPTSTADRDDRQSFAAYEGFLAYRQRLTPDVATTVKYSFTRGDARYRNTDALTGADTTPFSRLVNAQRHHSAEIRLDGDLSDQYSVNAGYAHSWDRRKNYGRAVAIDPGTGLPTTTPFDSRDTPETGTGWIEATGRFSDRFHITLGEYYGKQTGSESFAQPKVVAVYRPDDATWISAMVIPIFRNDVAELAPVEALSDPAGLGYLNFVEGGGGRSYELRFQRQMGRSANVTASMAYQRVRGLLIDVEDPSITGLPNRVLVDRGHRWVAGASYEQWLTDTLTGRVWVRWQDSDGVFPQAGVAGTEWPYVPEWQAGGRVDYIDENGFRVGLEGLWVDDRYHDAANTQVVDGFPLLNLTVQYQRNLHENYFVLVTNLAGKDYQTFLGFPQADTSVLGGVEYRF